MREVKDAEVRRNEILDEAEELFVTKGYNNTTIVDILNKVGIAKGTFYYYFKSKEEVMNEIIRRMVDSDVEKARLVVKDNSLDPVQKIQRIFLSQKPEIGDRKDKLIEQLHVHGNAEMHQKSLVQSMYKISPVISEVIEEGIELKLFDTEYPLETVELLIASGNFMFDICFYYWSEEEKKRRVSAFIAMVERSLGADKGTFDCIIDILFY